MSLHHAPNGLSLLSIDIGESPIREKLASPLFKTVVRAASICSDLNRLSGHLRAPDVALSQFTHQQLNGFRRVIPKIQDPVEIPHRLLSRQPLAGHATILSAPEVANLWHLPAPEIRYKVSSKPEAARRRPRAPSLGFHWGYLWGGRIIGLRPTGKGHDAG